MLRGVRDSCILLQIATIVIPLDNRCGSLYFRGLRAGMGMPESFEDKSQDVAVLSPTENILGIPNKYFLGAGSLGFIVAVVVHWAFGAALGSFLLYSLYILHANDPQALDIWVAKIRSGVNRWLAGNYKRRRIIIFTLERND